MCIPAGEAHCDSFPELSSFQSFRRRDGRVAEGARLESVFTRKGNVGSNPTLSAIPFVIWYLQAGDTYADTDNQ